MSRAKQCCVGWLSWSASGPGQKIWNLLSQICRCQQKTSFFLIDLHILYCLIKTRYRVIYFLWNSHCDVKKKKKSLTKSLILLHRMPWGMVVHKYVLLFIFHSTFTKTWKTLNVREVEQNNGAHHLTLTMPTFCSCFLFSPTTFFCC